MRSKLHKLEHVFRGWHSSTGRCNLNKFAYGPQGGTGPCAVSSKMKKFEHVRGGAGPVQGPHFPS